MGGAQRSILDAIARKQGHEEVVEILRQASVPSGIDNAKSQAVDLRVALTMLNHRL